MNIEDVLVIYSIGLTVGAFLSGSAFIIGELINFAFKMIKRG